MKKLIPALITCLVFFGCGKDDTCDLNSSNIAGTYRPVSIFVKNCANCQETDVLVQSPNCERDDLITLSGNGTYQHIDAGVACSPTGNDSGTWSLSGNQLTVDNQIAVVSRFSCDELEFTRTEPSFGITYRTVLQKQ